MYLSQHAAQHIIRDLCNWAEYLRRGEDPLVVAQCIEDAAEHFQSWYFKGVKLDVAKQKDAC